MQKMIKKFGWFLSVIILGQMYTPMAVADEVQWNVDLDIHENYRCKDNDNTVTLHEYTNTNGDKSLLVAEEWNDHGVKLCPRGLRTWRSSTTKRPALYYYRLKGLDECWWMCLKGWTGENCNIPVTQEIRSNNGRNCNSTNLATFDWSQYAFGDKAGVMPKFEEAAYYCGYTNSEANNKTWHYRFLGAARISADGHGAWVSNLVARACYKEGQKKDNSCGTRIVKNNDTTAETLVCMQGYEVFGESCLPIDRETAAETTSVACSSLCYTMDAFEQYFKDNDDYALVYDETDKCMTYKCAMPYYVFAGDDRFLDEPGNRKCVPCVDTDTERKVIEDDKCVVLKENEVVGFNGKRVTATVTQASAMLLNSDGEPCWREDNPEAYQKCILGLDYSMETD